MRIFGRVGNGKDLEVFRGDGTDLAGKIVAEGVSVEFKRIGASAEKSPLRSAMVGTTTPWVMS